MDAFGLVSCMISYGHGVVQDGGILSSAVYPIDEMSPLPADRRGLLAPRVKHDRPVGGVLLGEACLK